MRFAGSTIDTLERARIEFLRPEIANGRLAFESLFVSRPKEDLDVFA